MQQKQRQQQQQHQRPTTSNKGTPIVTPNPAAMAAAAAMSGNIQNGNYQQILSENNAAAPSSLGVPDSNGLGMDFLASPDMATISPNVGVSPKKDMAKTAATNHSKSKSINKKPSPINLAQSNTATPNIAPTVISSRSVTPAMANFSSAASPSIRPPVTTQKTPSPLTVSPLGQAQSTTSNSNVDNPFKEEEENLRSLNIRKGEIISRFKHRQEIFSKSPVDMFLSTLADCVGVKDDEVDLVMKIPQSIIDQVNGTGKKRLSKAAQRAKDQDVVSLNIKENKLIMESKTQPSTRSYSIPGNALASIFKNVYGAGVINSMNFSESTPNGSFLKQINNKKRKFEDFEISPANSNGSPSSSLMSDSKKVKIDSPEDMFSSKIGGDSSTKQVQTPAAANIWDWNYWSAMS